LCCKDRDEGEVSADYRKTVVPVSGDRFRRTGLTFWDKNKRKIHAEEL
jgi:hypothetical protein